MSHTNDAQPWCNYIVERNLLLRTADRHVFKAFRNRWRQIISEATHSLPSIIQKDVGFCSSHTSHSAMTSRLPTSQPANTTRTYSHGWQWQRSTTPAGYRVFPSGWYRDNIPRGKQRKNLPNTNQIASCWERSICLLVSLGGKQNEPTPMRKYEPDLWISTPRRSSKAIVRDSEIIWHFQVSLNLCSVINAGYTATENNEL